MPIASRHVLQILPFHSRRAHFLPPPTFLARGAVPVWSSISCLPHGPDLSHVFFFYFHHYHYIKFFKAGVNSSPASGGFNPSNGRRRHQNSYAGSFEPYSVWFGTLGGTAMAPLLSSDSSPDAGNRSQTLPLATSPDVLVDLLRVFKPVS